MNKIKNIAIMEILFVWVILSVVVGAIGSDRSIGFGGAFFLSLLLSPLVGFIITVVSKSNADVKFQKEMATNHRQQNISTADELAKLKKLKDDSVLTEDEYQAQKKKLLEK